MPDGLETFSPQDMQDLQDIATHLPAGHPMQAKLSTLLSSQPTQFEKDRGVGGAAPSTYQKLTAPDQTTQNPVARTLSNAGAGLIATPETVATSLPHSRTVNEMADALMPRAGSNAKPVAKTDSSTAPLGILDSLKAWTNPNTWKGAGSVLPEALGQGIGSVAGAEATGKLLPSGNASNGGLKNVGQEVMNEGPSKLRVLEDQHAHATAAQRHVAEVAKSVHDDAQTAMANVSQKIDGAKPEGVFDKQDVSNRVVDAIGDTADPATLPKSIRNLLPGDGLDSMRKSTGPSVGGRHFDLSNPSDFKAYQKLKDQGAFTPQEVNRMEGTASGDMHTFGELQQIRGKVWKEMQSLSGPPQAASSAVYKELSNMLREGARDAGVEPEWIDATARWKGYNDDFHRSPLKKTLEGDNAHEIMDPLANDKTRIQVRDILSKYKPFGADVGTLDQEIGRYNLQNKIDRLGQPSKWTVLGAMVSPKAAAIKTAAARSLRSPKVADAVMGKGFDAPVIKPSQVYPTKEAAARALKGKD